MAKRYGRKGARVSKQAVLLVTKILNLAYTIGAIVFGIQGNVAMTVLMIGLMISEEISYHAQTTRLTAENERLKGKKEE